MWMNASVHSRWKHENSQKGTNTTRTKLNSVEDELDCTVQWTSSAYLFHRTEAKEKRNTLINCTRRNCWNVQILMSTKFIREASHPQILCLCHSSIPLRTASVARLKRFISAARINVLNLLTLHIIIIMKLLSKIRHVVSSFPILHDTLCADCMGCLQAYEPSAAKAHRLRITAIFVSMSLQLALCILPAQSPHTYTIRHTCRAPPNVIHSH